jgi:hypothetical protein
LSYTVTIKSGLVDVVLPDGNRYQGGNIVTLSDAEYAMLSPTAASALFSGSTAKSDAGTDSSVFNVADYGAKGDGKIVIDAVMNSGSGVLTSASNPFTSDDVTKTVLIDGAGPGGAPLVGVISSFTNAGSVTLSVAASASVSAKVVMLASDDTAAFQGAVNAAVAYALAHSGSATVYVPSAAGKFYGVFGTLQTGTATKGNAQITLPIVPATGPKVTLTITGPSSGAGVQHWQQNWPNTTGATIVSFGVFANASAQSTSINNSGNPSVIGGPSQPGGYGISPGVFSNMYVDIANLSILTAHSPSGYTYTALDLSGVACARIRDFAYSTTGVVAGGSYGNPNVFGSGASAGLLMPANGNNDLCVIDNVICGGGYTYGLLATEHTDIVGLRILYCWAALCPVGNYFGSVGAAHSITGSLISIEQCTYLLHFVGVGSSGIGPVIYLKIDTETSTPKFGDRNSGAALAAARGEVVLGGLFTPSGLTLDGPVGFTIRNIQDAFPVKTVTSAYTVTAFDEVIMADASSAAFQVTLPTAVGRTRRITVKRINATNNVTVGTTSGQTIDGSATAQTLSTQWSSITVVPTPTGNWIKV